MLDIDGIQIFHNKGKDKLLKIIESNIADPEESEVDHN